MPSSENRRSGVLNFLGMKSEAYDWKTPGNVSSKPHVWPPSLTQLHYNKSADTLETTRNRCTSNRPTHMALVLATDPDSQVCSGSSTTRTRTVATGFTTPKTRTFGIGPVLPAKAVISTSQFELQLRIWVLIVSSYDEYIDCAVLAPLSPPAFRFVIWAIFVESLLKTREFRLKFLVIPQRFNEYWSDRKSESGR